MCYNFRVKSKAIFTISLCAALAIGTAAAFGGSSLVFAATTSTTDYPTTLTGEINDNLDGLVDFATDGDDSYAFADKDGIIVVENKERIKYDIKNVSALDYFNGTYYYKQGNGSYSLPSKETVDYKFSDYSFARLSDGSDYIIHTDAKCYYRANGELSYSPLDGLDDYVCYKLKVYNNIAYAIIESSATKTVKKLSGTTYTDVNPTYIDFKAVDKVSLGTIKNSLKTYNLNNDKLNFATLEDGSYYTKINIDNLFGEYFDVSDKNNEELTYKDLTFKCGDKDAISDDDVLLVLGESGKTKVFTYGGECYMAHSDNLKTDDYAESTSIAEADFNGFVNANEWIYSSPYDCNATKAFKLTALDTVKVTGITTQIGDRRFYRVELGENDEKVIGYVPEEFIEPYPVGEVEHPDENNFGVIEDPHYTDDDLVKIVVLLLIVIALVLFGFTYITYVLTSKKYREFKKNRNDKSDENDKTE